MEIQNRTCDDCGEEFDPVFGVCRNVLHKQKKKKTSIALAITRRGGSVSWDFANSLGSIKARVKNYPDLEMADYSIDGRLDLKHEIVRSRSRLFRGAFEKTEADYALLLDDDHALSQPVIDNMVALATKFDLDVIGAIYPKKCMDASVLKAKIFWADAVLAHCPQYSKEDVALAENILANPFRHAFNYPDDFPVSNFSEKAPSPHGFIAEVDGLGFGCMLVSRAAYVKMTAAYMEELGANDAAFGGKTVMLFQTMFTGKQTIPITDVNNKEFTSEDLAWCYRWRQLDGKIFMYMGPGAPLKHIGEWPFEADVSCINAIYHKEVKT